MKKENIVKALLSLHIENLNGRGHSGEYSQNSVRLDRENGTSAK